ncbi:MAG: type II toxin-antitoxin system VapC family toxin [Nanoarchaeota archaeon]|nr:type II toxin-antitoxin system VapC family toxin [Nanoarchaeota archaeon]
MKMVVDTSVLVEIDRHKEQTIRLLQKLAEQEELFISTVTVAEILTGAHLRKDASQALLKAKEVLNQFLWVDVDGEVADIVAKLYAFLLFEKKEKSIEYPDVLIAATFLSLHGDILLTLNKKDFQVFPQLKEKVCTPEEFATTRKKEKP